MRIRLSILYSNLRSLLRKSYIQVGIMVFLITILSFGIGYIVGRDFNPAPIIIEKDIAK